MRVQIVDRNADGRGRGRAGNKVALVSQAHPGEEVAMRVDRTTRGTVQGRVARLIKADPQRLSHPCPHEFRCTGCSFLAVSPAAEGEIKTANLHRVLESAGVAPQLSAEIVMPAGPFFYRHWAKQIFGRVRRRVVLGSYIAGTHHVVDNHSCPVLVPTLARLMDNLVRRVRQHRLLIHGDEGGGLRYALARQSAASGEQLLVLVTSDPDLGRLYRLAKSVAGTEPNLRGVVGLVNAQTGSALLAGNSQALWGEPAIWEEVLGYRHHLGPETFFQINPPAAAVIFRAAVELAGNGEHVVEAFAGTGALTLPLTDVFARVTAVESSGPSVRALRDAAARYQRQGTVEVIEGDAYKALPALLARCPDVLVLDPPRRGLGPELVAAITTARIRRLVLVACGIDSLARDLPALSAAGYVVHRVAPVDQFPRTSHFETVVGLRR